MDISHPVDSESPLPRAGADPTKPTPLEPFPLLGKLGQGTDLDVYADEPPTTLDLPHPGYGAWVS